jgi:hypothetical protein
VEVSAGAGRGGAGESIEKATAVAMMPPATSTKTIAPTEPSFRARRLGQTCLFDGVTCAMRSVPAGIGVPAHEKRHDGPA